MQIMSMRFVGHVDNGHIKIVKFLLSDEVTNKFGKVNIHADNEYAFHWACKMIRIEIVRLLLSLNIEDVKKFINKIYENEIYKFILDDPFILIRILNINNEYRNKLEHF